MGIAGLVLAAAALQAGQAPARHPQPLPEPVVDPVRVEVRISTTARTTRLQVLQDAFVVGAVSQATVSGSARAAIEQDGVAITGNADGAAAIATFRLVLSSNQATLRLMAGVSPGRTATVEVWNLNDEARPARVAEFTAVEGLVLDTNMSLLRTGGPLPGPHRDRLVLAHWYPWWDPVAWTDPHLLDQPLRLYSTDNAGRGRPQPAGRRQRRHRRRDRVVAGQRRRRRLEPAAAALRAGRRAAGRPQGHGAPRDAGRQQGRTRGRDARPRRAHRLDRRAGRHAGHAPGVAEGGRPAGHPRLRLGIRRRRHLAHGAGPRPRRRPQSADDRRTRPTRPICRWPTAWRPTPARCSRRTSAR